MGRKGEFCIISGRFEKFRPSNEADESQAETQKKFIHKEMLSSEDNFSQLRPYDSTILYDFHYQQF